MSHQHGSGSGDDVTVINYRETPLSPHLKQPGFSRPQPGGRNGERPSGTRMGVCTGEQQQPAQAVCELPEKSLKGSLPDAHWSPDAIFSRNEINPLLAAAHPVMMEMTHLNQAVDEPNIESFRQRLVRGIQDFERACNEQQVDEESLIYARYVLCTVLDELVNKTPWQHKGEWNRHSLLAQFHGATGGGDKFFALLEHLSQQPAKNLNCLELMFVCLNLGFEGKYHLLAKGHLQLEKVKEGLYQAVRRQRGDIEQQLSIHWQGIRDKQNPLMRYVPAWVFMAVTGVLLLSMFTGFSVLMERRGDAILAELTDLPTALIVHNPPSVVPDPSP